MPYGLPSPPVRRSIPRELRGGFVVPRRRVVVEAVLRAFVLELLVRLAVRFERGLERRDAVADAGVDGRVRVVQHQRRLDLRRVFSARLAAVERRAGVEIFAKPHGELIDDAAAEAEADRAEFA